MPIRVPRSVKPASATAAAKPDDAPGDAADGKKPDPAKPAQVDDEPNDDAGSLSAEDENEGDAAAASHDSARYAEYIRKIIPKVKERALEKLVDKIDASTDKKMGRLSMALVGFSFVSFLLLLMPLTLRKKYPG